jgi:AAA+ ATPase superfamily predicted ATPase
MAFEIKKDALSDELKALDHQVDLGKGKPFPNSNFLYLIIGGVGSGKTSLALNLLKIDRDKGGFRKAYNRIYVVSPTAKYDDKWDRLIHEVDEEGNYYNECSDETIEDIMDKLEAFNEEWKMEEETRKKKRGKPSSVVIIDDCVDAFNRRQKNKLNKLVLTLRHLKTSVWIMSQKLNAVPQLIRAQARCISFFPTLNRREEETLVNEINIDDTLYKKLIGFAGDGNDHPFLHIKIGEGKPAFFRKFDRITLT